MTQPPDTRAWPVRDPARAARILTDEIAERQVRHEREGRAKDRARGLAPRETDEEFEKSLETLRQRPVMEGTQQLVKYLFEGDLRGLCHFLAYEDDCNPGWSRGVERVIGQELPRNLMERADFFAKLCRASAEDLQYLNLTNFSERVKNLTADAASTLRYRRNYWTDHTRTTTQTAEERVEGHLQEGSCLLHTYRGQTGKLRGYVFGPKRSAGGAVYTSEEAAYANLRVLQQWLEGHPLLQPAASPAPSAGTQMKLRM